MADLFPEMVRVIAPCAQGDVVIRHFAVGEGDAGDYNPANLQPTSPGVWCQLEIDGVGWMYDLPVERRWNEAIVREARGQVLIGGLGLGMILHAILPKPEVAGVTVLEINRNVIDLVLPTLESVAGREKLTVVECDAAIWLPPGWRDLARELGWDEIEGTEVPIALPPAYYGTVAIPRRHRCLLAGPDTARYDAIWLDCVPFYSQDRWWFRLAEAWMDRYRPFLRNGTSFLGHWALMEVLQAKLDAIYEDEAAQLARARKRLLHTLEMVRRAKGKALLQDAGFRAWLTTCDCDRDFGFEGE